MADDFNLVISATPNLNEVETALANLKAKYEKLHITVETDGLDSLAGNAGKAGDKAGQSFRRSFESSSKLDKVQLQIDTGKLDTQIKNVENKMSSLNNVSKETRTNVENLSKSFDVMKTAGSIEAKNAEYQKFNITLSAATTQLNATATAERNMAQAATELNNLQAWMNKNTKAAEQYKDVLDEIQKRLRESAATGSDLSNTRNMISNVKSEAKAAGLVTDSWASSFANVTKQVLGLSSTAMVIRKLISLIQDGVNTVVDLDTALVDLQKTTTMTASELSSFYYDANESAKQLGVTTQEIIESAADWSRLGFSDKQSATEMAELSAQMAAISPGVTIDEATTGLVSTIKAYGIEVENVLDGVMSKINIVGNTAATSNQEILQGLQNSAAALAGMDSTLDENIALFTAGQEIAQDASKVGKSILPKHMVTYGAILVA